MALAACGWPVYVDRWPGDARDHGTGSFLRPFPTSSHDHDGGYAPGDLAMGGDDTERCFVARVLLRG